MTYEEQVLNCADDNGNLSIKLFNAILKSHGHSPSTATDLNTTNAQALLHWLGY
jgi:hypothetical protein